MKIFMKTFKKGEWSLTTIAVFILILIVLVLLVIAFQDKFASLMDSFSRLLKGAQEAGGEELIKNAVSTSTTA